MRQELRQFAHKSPFLVNTPNTLVFVEKYVRFERWDYGTFFCVELILLVCKYAWRRCPKLDSR